MRWPIKALLHALTPLLHGYYTITATRFLLQSFCYRVSATPLLLHDFCYRVSATPLLLHDFCYRVSATPLLLHDFYYTFTVSHACTVLPHDAQLYYACAVEAGYTRHWFGTICADLIAMDVVQSASAESAEEEEPGVLDRYLLRSSSTKAPSRDQGRSVVYFCQL